MGDLRVCVSGACGKMGSEVVRAIAKNDGVVLTAAVDFNNVGKSIGEIANTADQVIIEKSLKDALVKGNVDVVVDFTNHSCIYENTKNVLEAGIPIVIGTTGFTKEQVVEIKEICQNKKIGALWATNFAIGAILMMEFAGKAAKYFDDVEIIEYHHDNKLDAPSGTSLTTANIIKEVRKSKQQGHPEEKELIQGARGADFDGFRIHSVRMPGFIAHQEVIFGSLGQILTIRHDSMNRESFMPGVILACKKIVLENKFIEGLDKLL
ncbi:MAG: 4-hydroxy-tetrahydrodipicolinate reductase [Fusobacteria bacterium]|nr:4-hydroxy-tetrahydrodipicolinate reductase [Fusobacteriota bacterium]